jgi:hypothetical protein
MPEHEGLGTDLHFLQDDPDDPLAIGERQSLGGLVELGEKTLKALGQRHVRLSVGQLRLESDQLRFGRRLALSQWQHARAQLLQREQLQLRARLTQRLFRHILRRIARLAWHST